MCIINVIIKEVLDKFLNALDRYISHEHKCIHNVYLQCTIALHVCLGAVLGRLEFGIL